MKCFSHRVNALAGRLNRHKDYFWWKVWNLCAWLFSFDVIELVVSREMAVGGGRVCTNTLLRDEFFIILCVGVNLESYWWQTFFYYEEILQPWKMLQNIMFVFQKCEWPMTAPSSSFWLQHYYIFSQLHLRRIILYFLFCDITSETENGHDAKVALPINGRGCGSFTSLISWENSHKN